LYIVIYLGLCKFSHANLLLFGKNEAKSRVCVYDYIKILQNKWEDNLVNADLDLAEYPDLAARRPLVTMRQSMSQ
jgi:hypothetical protein